MAGPPDIAKSTFAIEGVRVAAVGASTWRFTSGTQPHTSVFQVHQSDWLRLASKVGREVTLMITDSRRLTFEVRGLTIIHTAPSDSPNRVSFVVADRRWKWQYVMVARDYNMIRKTGDRTVLNPSVPVETRITKDEYDYFEYSLNRVPDTSKGAKPGAQQLVAWTAAEALMDCLRHVEGEKGWRIESFPMKATAAEGQFTLQNITLRDQGNAAVARLLSYIPGASIRIDSNGQAVVYDSANLTAAQNYASSLPPATWDGDHLTLVDREAIRPSKVVVHYQREVEAMFNFRDNYEQPPIGGADNDREDNEPFLENVIPTCDDKTTVNEYQIDLGVYEEKKDLPPGTWVRFDDWLTAMNKKLSDTGEPKGSWPWTFETIRRHWIIGDLDGALGGHGTDMDPLGNVATRIANIKQHFRRTFRMNKKYVSRCRDILDVRVAIIDPISGSRAGSAIWGQACNIPSNKGTLMAARRASSGKGPEYVLWRNVDQLKEFNAGKPIITSPQSPAKVSWVDKDLGIFSVNWIVSPYGSIAKWIPCNVSEGANEKPGVIRRDVSRQQDKPVVAGGKITASNAECMLSYTCELRVILTLVPAAPNNKFQFHNETVQVSDLRKMFKGQFGIAKGRGPDLHLFVPPNESTARYGWSLDDKTSELTLIKLFGLEEDDPDKKSSGKEPKEKDWLNKGITPKDMEEGFKFVNLHREIFNHSRSYAAEMISGFADNIQGRRSTILPADGVFLRGNMSGATIVAAAAPSSKISVLHEFPGQAKPVSRLALLPETARRIILGILPFKGTSGNGP